MTDDRTRGERYADAAVRMLGTWRFLIGQSVFILTWCLTNIWLLRAAGTRSFDPFPFVFLNLCLSVQAAVTGPLLLLAGNRQQQKDRQLDMHDFAIDQEALSRIMEMHERIMVVEWPRQ